MIIGRGNVATKIQDRQDVLFFASGISDSSCIDDKQFSRERDLFISSVANTTLHVVYFSSLSIYISDTPYNRHKKSMEALVKEMSKSYTIIRLGVCEWAKNPTTIQNVFKKKIENNEPIEIQDTYRWITPLKDFQYWTSKIRVGEKEEMNISGKLVTVLELLNMIKAGEL